MEFNGIVKFKPDGKIMYSPCEIYASAEGLAFQKIGIAPFVVGGIPGRKLAEISRQSNAAVIIPMSDIISVQTKANFAMATVTVVSKNYPKVTFACISKKEMNQVAAALGKY